MIMKKQYLILAALLLAACQEKEPAFVTTDQGPRQTVTWDRSALMGSVVDFSVDLDDPVALSTLKVALLFDETVVADTTIRTKTVGTYEGFLKVPFLKDIPDGVATLRVTSQNIQFGLTEEDYDVRVTRPDFAYLTLHTEDGDYRMERTGRNQYAVGASFGAEVNATISTPAIDAAGRTLTFGYGASGIDTGEAGLIPFSNGVAGTYEISFNTLTYEGAPFVILTVNGEKAVMVDRNNYAAVVRLTQGAAVTFDGYDFDGFLLDPDFFRQGEDGTVTFAAVDGLYKVTIQLANRFFLVEKMVSTTAYATYADGGAVWCIGADYGKPAMFSASWNTDLGLCLAEVSPGIHQITFEAGFQLSTASLNIKFFHQKGWGGEFGGGSTTTDSPLLSLGASDGNVHLADGVSLEVGGVYRFTLDVTGYDGTSGAVLHLEKVGQNEYEEPQLAINGVAFTGGPTVFEATVALTQGSGVQLSGLEDIASYWIDPDYFTGGRFQAVSGDYKVILDTADKTIQAWRVKADGSRPNLEEGGLYLLGWGVAAVRMTSQLGWTQSDAYALAQVSPGVYQFTGQAVAETDGTIGGRWRTDYTDAKCFYAFGSWDGQGAVNLTEAASEWLTQSDGGNFNYVKPLTEGATYVLTFDLAGCTVSGSTVTGTPTVDFKQR